MANELRFADGNLLFDGGNLAMSDDCCCDEPIACGECGMSATSSFLIDIPGIGSILCDNNLAYGPSSNCNWGGTDTGATSCGLIRTGGVQWNLLNGGWNVSFDLANSPFGIITWRSDLDVQLLGCGPWTVSCTKIGSTPNGCAETGVTTYIVTVTLL